MLMTILIPHPRSAEEIGRSTPIASVSLGAPRRFLLRGMSDREDCAAITLASGSLTIMENECQVLCRPAAPCCLFLYRVVLAVCCQQTPEQHAVVWSSHLCSCCRLFHRLTVSSTAMSIASLGSKTFLKGVST